jgi:hypothetical protein
MSMSKSQLSIVMAVYIGMYLAVIMYNLNFAILIQNEIYRRNRRSVSETVESQEVSFNKGGPKNCTGELAALIHDRNT